MNLYVRSISFPESILKVLIRGAPDKLIEPSLALSWWRNAPRANPKWRSTSRELRADPICLRSSHTSTGLESSLPGGGDSGQQSLKSNHCSGLSSALDKRMYNQMRIGKLDIRKRTISGVTVSVILCIYWNLNWIQMFSSRNQASESTLFVRQGCFFFQLSLAASTTKLSLKNLNSMGDFLKALPLEGSRPIR